MGTGFEVQVRPDKSHWESEADACRLLLVAVV